MKAPLVFGSLLALAGTSITAERADASIMDGEIVDDELKSAICVCESKVSQLKSVSMCMLFVRDLEII